MMLVRERYSVRSLAQDDADHLPRDVRKSMQRI